MENLYYPTGETTKGRTVVCLCCENDKPVLESIETPNEIERSLKEWLDKNDYCVEQWQMDEAMYECGHEDYYLMEMDGGMDGGGAHASLSTTPGMGPVSTPTGNGTNTDFHNSSKTGSGDKFPSLTAGTPAAKKKGKKKKKVRKVKTYLDFLSAMKNLQGK